MSENLHDIKYPRLLWVDRSKGRVRIKERVDKLTGLILRQPRFPRRVLFRSERVDTLTGLVLRQPRVPRRCDRRTVAHPTGG